MLGLNRPAAPATIQANIVLAMGVFVVAVLLRLSSCYESFWIDELHTAWTIHDGLAEVAPRARLGNQMPVYFWLLWSWQALVGESEVALRLTSVFAVAVASAWLTIIVARETNSLIAAGTAGLILAVESNALFFGTELRPYAAVMLVSTIALGSTLRLLREQNAVNPSPRVWTMQLVLTGCLVAGILLQPTSLGVLLWSPFLLVAASMFRRNSMLPQFGVASIIQTSTVIAVLLWAWQFTLHSSWELKDNWSSFAVPTWIGPYWQAWSWWPLAIGPLLVAVLTWYLSAHPMTTIFGRSLLLVSLAFVITFAYWLVAYLNLVPLWHRRYFVGVLPWLVAGTGFCVASIQGQLLHLKPLSLSKWQANVLTVLLGIVIVGGLMFQQRTLFRVARLPTPLVVRGENWRDAIAWLGQHRRPGEVVHIDAGLIEFQSYAASNHSLDARQRAYLMLPLGGPYQLPSPGDSLSRVKPFNRDLMFSLSTLGTPNPLSNDRIWVISRRSAKAMKSTLRKTIRRSGPFDYDGVRVTGFGNVSIAEIPRLQRPKRRGLFGF